jgi:putative ABC transport system permease protein
VGGSILYGIIREAMILNLLKQSFVNQKRAMALMILSVAMGTAVSAALITVSLEIRAKVSRELRSFGANITVEPRVEGLADMAGQRRYLREEDLVKAKTIFWRHNVIGLAPFLDSTVTLGTDGALREAEALGTWMEHELPMPGETGTFAVGVATVSPWWDVRGELPGARTVLVGEALAADLGIEPGAVVTLDGAEFTVSGLLVTGGPEDGKIVMDLGALQSLKGLPGLISRVQVSALTTPMDEFAYKDPKAMSPKEYDKWYCTGYVTSIAAQLGEVFKGARARPVWQVAETEGTVLDRLSVLVYLLTAAVLVAAALGMSTTMTASLLRRLEELGLMKALGADSFRITFIFLTEAGVIGLIGGVAGYFLAWGASHYIGLLVFGSALEQHGLLLPVALGNALGIACLGSLLPIRRALAVKPALVLKGGV